MESNLPAIADEAQARTADEAERVEPSRPISVAFLPLALVTFVVLAFVIATWTFLHAAV